MSIGSHASSKQPGEPVRNEEAYGNVEDGNRTEAYRETDGEASVS